MARVDLPIGADLQNVNQPSNGAVACDYDNDGDLDIFVSAYGVTKSLDSIRFGKTEGTFTNVAVDVVLA